MILRKDFNAKAITSIQLPLKEPAAGIFNTCESKDFDRNSTRLP